MASSQDLNIISLIKSEHREAESLYKEYESTSDLTKKQECAWKLIRAVSQHGAKEETSIYSWMKKRDPQSVALIDHGREEHQKVKEDLAALDKLNVKDDPSFDATIRRVWKDLSHHVLEEETKILPRLEEIATASELIELGRTFNQQPAPTHPHPYGPSSGGVTEKMANAGAEILDKARDAASGRFASEKTSERKWEEEKKQQPL